VAFVSNLPGDRPMNLSVTTASLEDPPWILAHPAPRIVPRAGIHGGDRPCRRILGAVGLQP
jgi:hypothetical protein